MDQRSVVSLNSCSNVFGSSEMPKVRRVHPFNIKVCSNIMRRRQICFADKGKMKVIFFVLVPSFLSVTPKPPYEPRATTDAESIRLKLNRFIVLLCVCVRKRAYFLHTLPYVLLLWRCHACQNKCLHTYVYVSLLKWKLLALEHL